MRLTEDERTSFSRFRDVSELRTQFQCEYKLYLMQQRGEVLTKASIDGAMLHNQIVSVENDEPQAHHRIPLTIIVLIIVIGILWIIW